MNRFLHPFIRSVIINELGEQSAEEEKAPQMPYVPIKLEKRIAMRQSNDANADEVVGIDRVSGTTPLFGMDYPIYLKNMMSGKDGSICDVLMCVAMYNESIKEFNSTMQGVAENLRFFHKYGYPSERIACIVIVDGPNAFLSEVRQREAKFKRQSPFRNFFDEEIITQTFGTPIDKCTYRGIEDHEEFAHVFVHDIKFKEDQFPLQLIFCIKQFNKRKLNTHLWFFGGFCEMIQPKYVILLDVGTRPAKKALFYMIEGMEVDENVAGTCGEIIPEYDGIWNPIEMAQVVEYKFAHIFDKALESVLGYITVLPGAFSAYRWEALQGEPLWDDYFKSLCHPEEMDCFHSNIYLAEDRVLCLALVSKAKKQYTLRYVKKSTAITDVPDQLSKLMAQRRRWINGSWFALIKALTNFTRIRKSGHSTCRKCLLYGEMIYYYINVLIAWLMVGSFFLVFAIAVRTEFDYDGDADFFAIGNYIVMSYMLLLTVVFILSLAVKPNFVESIFKGVAAILGLFMLFTLYLMVALLFDDRVEPVTVMMILGTMLAFLINMVVNCAVFSILKGIIQFLYLTPTYINIFLIYAICNIDDCSWGNRPDRMTPEEVQKKGQFEHFRARWVLIWLLCNFSFGYALNSMDKESEGNLIYLSIIAIVGGSLLLLRTLFGVIYVIQEQCCKKKLSIPEREEDSADQSLLRQDGDRDNFSYMNKLNECLSQADITSFSQNIGLSEERIMQIMNGQVNPDEEEIQRIMNYRPDNRV